MTNFCRAYAGRADPRWRRLLAAEVQGNILLPFPDFHQAFLLARFEDRPRARSWLAGLLPWLTTTDRLPAGSRVCHAVSFTESGLRGLAPKWARGLMRSTAWREGPAHRAGKLADRGRGDPARWLFGGPQQAPADALLTIAALDGGIVEEHVQRHLAHAPEHGVEIVHVQRGAKLGGRLAGCEHFGFRDGISQPAIRGFQACPDGGAAAWSELGEFVLGYPRYGGLAPWPCPEWARNGTFQVFKRLDQDVPGWQAQLRAVSRRLSRGAPVTEELAGAMLMGRWPNGAPLALAPKECGGVPAEAPFDFESDPEGRVTPRCAHIRKMNPRTGQAIDREWHRIIRRGVPFGSAYEPGEPDAAVERGLLFNAFMANIEQQFEFIMRGWANDPDFPEAGDGPDPLIGVPSAPALLHDGRGAQVEVQLERFVHTSGAVYAFAPSRSSLHALAEG